MRSLESLRILMQDRRTDIVARLSGVSISALRKIRLGETKPRAETIKKLSAYFDKQIEQADKVR